MSVQAVKATHGSSRMLISVLICNIKHLCKHFVQYIGQCILTITKSIICPFGLHWFFRPKVMVQGQILPGKGMSLLMLPFFVYSSK